MSIAMLVNRHRVLVAIILGLLIAVMNPIEPANAAADSAGPVILSTYLTPTTLDVSAADGVVNVSIRITDDTGVDAPILRLINHASGQYQLQRLSLGTGTIQSGVWKGPITVKQGAAAGKWSLETVGLKDTLGNQTGNFVELRTITVTSTAN